MTHRASLPHHALTYRDHRLTIPEQWPNAAPTDQRCSDELMSSQPPHQQTITTLETDFPEWRIWRTTDAGTWWASRRGPRWNHEPRTLAADTPEQLRTHLQETHDPAGPGEPTKATP
jgi:hypothetical protein